MKSPWVTLVAASGQRGWTRASTVFTSMTVLMVVAVGLDRLRRGRGSGH